MVTQWDTQVDHVKQEWQADTSTGEAFVWFNLISQSIPCVLLLINGAVPIPKGLIRLCVFSLVLAVLGQSIVYHVRTYSIARVS